ncbi:unnamed protein product [Toxocara canis]|uniref:Zf-RVT domain-containing protein n=1 Tax=Toxocara canis TaxID=6265 RepID=A0A183UXV6_TOXCA|nr:unnamed protein product [Toxocara canis]
MRTSLSCWYELAAPDDLLIWEGICAIRIASDKTLVLVKLISGMPVFTELGIWHGKVRSDGYWTCAQLEGEFRSGDQIFYHCKSPQDAFTMIHLQHGHQKTQFESQSTKAYYAFFSLLGLIVALQRKLSKHIVKFSCLKWALHGRGSDRSGVAHQNLETFLDSRLLILSVRLDPDPLRLQDHRSIESRMNQWNLLKRCVAANRFRLIPDSTLPL